MLTSKFFLLKETIYLLDMRPATFYKYKILYFLQCYPQIACWNFDEQFFNISYA